MTSGHCSFSARSTPILRIGIGLGVLLFLVAAASLPRTFTRPAQTARARHSHKGKPRLSLYGNGYFRALHGRFLLKDDQLHVYRSLPTVLNPKTNKLEPVPEEDELKPHWKGEPYYHETYRLEEGEWVPKPGEPQEPGQREFSSAPEEFLDFGSCDPRDAIDLPNSEIKKALWPGVKIKAFMEFGHYAAVVFSAIRSSSAGVPADQSSQRMIHVALLARTQKRWEMTGSVKVFPAGYFCGTRTLSTMRGENKRTVLLLFTADGDHNVLDSFVAD